MAETEKLTINLSPVDLGTIELLVSEGFYASRAELIRLAIHNQLARHAGAVTQASDRHAMVIGALTYSRRTLERVREKGERISVRVVGLFGIEADVPADLARDTIESVRVHGIYKASPEVKAALAERTEGARS